MKRLAKIILLLEVAFFIFLVISPLIGKRTLDFTGDKALTVNDNGFQHRVSTQEPNVGAVLAKNSIVLNEGDEVFPVENTEILPGMHIHINRQASVKIHVDGDTHEKSSFSKTVEDVLLEHDITVSHLDIIEPHHQTRLSDNMEIVVTRVETEQITEEEPIKFEVVKKKDKSIYWGEEKINQTGKKGVRETTYKITYENGEQVSKKKLASKITQSPTSKIILVGTKIKVGKTKSGIASWYSHTGTMAGTSRTFPYGTWLRVTSRENGKQVFVRVNDYGPQKSTGRLIDLDKKAFVKLAPLGKGLVKVKIEEVLNKGFDPS